MHPLVLNGLASLLAAEIDDIHADGTLTIAFIVALVVAVLFFHAPRRIARLADYFETLGLPIAYRGGFAWWLEGRYRGVPLKIECGSRVKASGPFALVATIQFTEELHIDARTLLPEGTTVFAAGPGHLQVRLPEELHEPQSAWEPLALIDRLIDLDPNATPKATPSASTSAAPRVLPADAYPFRPWQPLPLLLSVAGAGAAVWCANAASFFAAALVLCVTLLGSVLLSNRRNRPATLASRRAWGAQVSLVLALCILGVGLVWTRYGMLSLQDFDPVQIGNVVVIPDTDIQLRAYRQLERGQGQIGPGGQIFGYSLVWKIQDQKGEVFEDNRLTLRTGEFAWIAPTWDGGEHRFIFGILREYGGYQALTLQPVWPDAAPAAAGVTPDYHRWMICKPPIPPGTPLAKMLADRIRFESQHTQSPARE